ncbi:8-amino-7-oxononanoate synthase [Paenibacillus abyssi]|uniref:8-amino-7-ketopelargonate synthase n=1 Tax=Paenibacillus abyssi TaxID=1340531 RepID=A0A917CPY8_9BACL|nr:8-amino-7-oxononanoate synthase [Paenibacillus abyssi]GGF92453.1 putative 8-amino-7-oxononanoate synthase [Paenibacillus abyssi]
MNGNHPETPGRQMPACNPLAWMEEELADLARRVQERKLRQSETARADEVETAGAYTRRDGKLLMNLASNNYLGLAGDKRIHQAMIQALRGARPSPAAGAGASRLITGNYAAYTRLEQDIAAWKEREAALVYASGYMANTGTIAALVGRGDAVFSDRLNHASIVDGIVLSRAGHYRYRHNDTGHLRQLLERHQDARRKLIITDAVFSMDGDTAPLRELLRLRDEFGAMLMVDEAHSGGIYGRQGEGLCHALGIHRQVDVLMGTFSKAFGVYGAYVCGSSTLIRYLTNKSRTLIYSTGLPPAVIAGIQEALNIVRTEGWRRTRVLEAARSLRSRLRAAGLDVGEGDSPILPVIAGSNATALAFGARLEEAGILAGTIRPPTVPAGSARLRLSLTALHTEAQLDEACRQIIRNGRELGVIQ